MRILLVLGVIASWSLYGQRTVTGKVLDQFFDPDYCNILLNDSTRIGETDFQDGNFSVVLPDTNAVLTFYSVYNLSKTVIYVPVDCKQIDLITIPYGSCHLGRSPRKIDRIRKKVFNGARERHKKAIEEGIFESPPCYSFVFQSIRAELEAIRQDMRRKSQQIQQDFRNLEPGDTIYIPFATDFRYDGTDRTTLTYYSAFAGNIDKRQFSCYLEAIVIGKYRKRSELNLVFEVVNFAQCLVHRPILDGREVTVGARFVYDMRNFDLYLE